MERARDYLFLVYFMSHIPLTIVFDSQIILPRWLYPEKVLNIFDNYATSYNDPLVGRRPCWFQAFCVCELVVQLPFCFVATYVFWNGISRNKWVRLPIILYSSHVVTSMVPIYFHIILEDFSNDVFPGPHTLQERLTLAMIYLPYLMVPICLLADALFSPVYLRSMTTADESKKKL